MPLVEFAKTATLMLPFIVDPFTGEPIVTVGGVEVLVLEVVPVLEVEVVPVLVVVSVLGRVGGSKGRSVAHAKSGSVTVLVVPVLVVPMLVLPVLGVPVRSYQCWSWCRCWACRR